MNVGGWVAKGLIAVVLIGAIAGTHVWIERITSDVMMLKKAMEMRPHQQEAINNLQTQLDDRIADINRIRAYVPDRSDLAVAVNQIEAEGQNLGIVAEVTDIEEVIDPDTGQPIPGPVRDVILSISARGSSEDLIQFLYRVEHLPFLTQVSSWRLGDQQQGSSRSVSIPGTELNTSPASDQALTADVIMAIVGDEVQ